MIHQVTFKIGTTWHTGAFDDAAGTFVTQHRKEDTAKPNAIVQKPKIVRWLGMDWEGMPWPKRLRLRTPLYIARARGCGCIKKPKAAWRRILAWL